ncbi:MAG: PASTA domain-containing protein [Clostridia bacterium]|nr:PASTA domain-containing protein [Clostridia bacterium]
MSEKQLCMGCMSPLEEGDAKCPRCGYPVSGVNPPQYMRVRTVVGNRYLVGRVLEVSGDSAVYMGLDQLDNTPVTVREFFPTTLCDRNDKGTLTVKDGCAVRFEGYKRDFLACARAVARLRDVLAVVPCFDILEEHGTAYSISEYCEGMSLERYVRKNGPLSYEQARQLFLPLISAMSTIHLSGVLHLGISPKNVLMDEAGELRIKNFCIPETHTVNTACEPVLVHGYAAPEQYEEGAVCTATADVYALAATLFFALTGKTPPESTARTKKNEGLMMPAEVADSLPSHVKESLYRAMRISPNHRTQTAQQLWDELTATSAVAALLDNETEEEEDAPRKKSGGRGFVWLIFAGVLVVLALIAGGVLYSLGFISLGTEQTTTTTRPDLTMPPTTTTTIVTKQTGTATVVVEELFGRDFYTLKGEELEGKLTLSLIGYQFSDQPAGTILSQTPSAGTSVDRGAVIEVIISAGPKEKTMPDMAGWSEEHARLYLQALGYEVGESLLLQVSDYEAGIVEKTTPAAGEPIVAGETVTLWVSNVVADDPDVVG